MQVGWVCLNKLLCFWEIDVGLQENLLVELNVFDISQALHSAWCEVLGDVLSLG